MIRRQLVWKWFAGVVLVGLAAAGAFTTTLVGSASRSHTIRSQTATSPSTDASTAHAAVKRVLLVGDSLLNLSQAEVRYVLASHGWDPVIVSQSGTTIEFWSAKMRDLISLTRPDVVVIELGTNDCDGSCAGIAAAIDGLMIQLSTKTSVLWLNVQEQPLHPTNAKAVNAALADATLRYANLSLVDMSSTFSNHPEWHGSDGLHFSAAGAVELARLVQGALQPLS